MSGINLRVIQYSRLYEHYGKSIMWSLLLKGHNSNAVSVFNFKHCGNAISNVAQHSSGNLGNIFISLLCVCVLVGTLISWMSPWHEAPDGRRAIFITCIVDFHSHHESSLTDQHESDSKRLRRRCRGWTGAFNLSQRVLMMYFMWRRCPWICIRLFVITVKGGGSNSDDCWIFKVNRKSKSTPFSFLSTFLVSLLMILCMLFQREKNIIIISLHNQNQIT